MPFDKGKFVSEFTASGMEEAQAELLAESQANMLGQLPSKQDLVNLETGFKAEQADLRREFDGKINNATDTLRREVNDQTQKTRLLIDDVHSDIRKTEARLHGALKAGFAVVNSKFNVLAISYTIVILAVMAFMAFMAFMVYLFRG